MKIKDLVRDLSYKELKDRKWKHPRIWRKGKRYVFTNYLMSNDGRIIRKVDSKQTVFGKGRPFRGTELKGSLLKSGYRTFGLVLNGKLFGVTLHRLLYETWVKKIPKGLEINHKDGNKLGINLEKFETITHHENILHGIKTGLIWTKAHRKNLSERLRQQWKDPEYKEKIIKNLKYS